MDKDKSNASPDAIEEVDEKSDGHDTDLTSPLEGENSSPEKGGSPSSLAIKKN